MVAGWQPATGLEQALFEAIQRGDQQEYLRLLAGSSLLVPVQQDAAGRTTGWVTTSDGGRTFLLGYTSQEGLAGVAGRQVPCLATSIGELVRRWPDPDWWLAVNSGLPIEALVSPRDLAGAAALAEPAPEPAESAPEPAESASEPDQDSFQPANDVEAAMLDAVRQGDTDAYLKALIVAELVAPGGSEEDSLAPRITVSGEPAIPLFTSPERLAERYPDQPYELVSAITVVRDWQDRSVALALNPGTAIGAHLPGPQVAELAGWAAEIGLVDIMDEGPLVGTGEESGDDLPLYQSPETGPEPVGWLQKLLPHRQVSFYQERGYHLVSGFIHRLGDVGERVQPARLYQVLELTGEDPEFAADDSQVHAVRWPAYGEGRYGDPKRPTRSGVVPQSRVAGVPLPHGALLVRIDRAGEETVVACFDADVGHWLPMTQEVS